MLLAAEVLSRVLGMVVIMVAARMLGAANFGVLAFAASLIFCATLLLPAASQSLGRRA